MNPVTHPVIEEPVDWPVLPKDTPIIYEDEEDEANDMGEARHHRRTNVIVETGVTDHLREHWPKLCALSNINCYYAPGPRDKKSGSMPYFSSDVMVVDPFKPLPERLASYTIGRHGPSPLSALEVLSTSNAETNDKTIKPRLYADLKVGEYILMDPTGELLEEKLLLKQLQPDGTWKDIRDEDGGVTSKLGFRLIIDETDEVAVLDAATGKRYPRPDEAFAEHRARQLAEDAARVEAKRARDEAKRAEAEAKRADAETKRAKAEGKRADAEAKRADAEAESRRLAEEQLQTMRADLERLRAENETKNRGRAEPHDTP
jgi:Uma2 family endonuclease